MNTDKELFDLVEQEAARQKKELQMIASENAVSENVLDALGSILTNRYSEGFPKRRYYGGNDVIDEIEILAQDRALKVFGLSQKEWRVNVQPYSGSPANQAVYLALLEPGDTFMGLSLSEGGHLTHGHKVNFSAKFFNSVQYGVDENGEIDFDEVEKLAKEHKPKMIWAGATAYVKNYDYERFGKIAKDVGAFLVVDIAHVAGLIAADAHNSPFPYADVVTTTTHKTLRGPRGGMVFARKELIKQVEKALFPGLQGGPHNHTTAAIAVAMGEALTPAFKEYGKQIVKNAIALAEALKEKGIKLVGDGTENHLMLMDFSEFQGGSQVEFALNVAGIVTNKNTVPGDTSPYYPSGIRLGTPTLTTRGMNEENMKTIADWIVRVVEVAKEYSLPKVKEERHGFIKSMKTEMRKNKKLLEINSEVEAFASKFPLPGVK